MELKVVGTIKGVPPTPKQAKQNEFRAAVWTLLESIQPRTAKEVEPPDGMPLSKFASSVKYRANAYTTHVRDGRAGMGRNAARPPLPAFKVTQYREQNRIAIYRRK